MKKGKKIILLIIALCILGCAGAYIIRNHKESNQDGKITFTFDSNGGSTVKIMKIEKGEEVTLPSTVREGYTFTGWYVKGKKANNKVIAEKNSTFKAEWEKIPEDAKTFTISFDSTGGTEVADLVLECEKSVILPEDVTREGYSFITWIDENATPIQSGALLGCEDITLYAKWKKEETKKEEKKETKQKEYTCTEGKLDGDKCILEGTVKENCPEGTRVDGDLCIKVSEYITGERTCGKKIVNMGGGSTPTVQGIKVDAGTTFCYYGEVPDDQQTCHSRGRKWCASCGKCYVDMDQNYSTECPGEYQYYTSADILNKFGGHNNGGCYRKVDKLYSCEDGYNLENGKCLKTIAATEK